MSEDSALPDDVGSITQTSGFHLDEAELERGDYEIGVENGVGYIKLPVFADGEVMEFSIPKDEVEQYVERREEKCPTPSVPDGFSEKLSSPRDWEGGNTEHTGGGIYCRIWRKETSNYELEVIYGVPDPDGVGLNLYGDDGSWTCEVDLAKVPERTDDKAAQAANQLMRAVDEGAYDDIIEAKLGL